MTIFVLLSVSFDKKPNKSCENILIKDNTVLLLYKPYQNKNVFLFHQISYLASCPCLSDRTKFPNFFRTIPSDIYQARAMAQLAIRFNWTWMGAVIENNDYGQLAIQVYDFIIYIA